MPLYQVSFFDRRGRLSHMREIQSPSDDEAIQLMAQHSHEHSLEIWRGRELVWRFEARKVRRFFAWFWERAFPTKFRSVGAGERS